MDYAVIFMSIDRPLRCVSRTKVPFDSIIALDSTSLALVQLIDNYGLETL